MRGERPESIGITLKPFLEFADPAERGKRLVRPPKGPVDSRSWPRRRIVAVIDHPRDNAEGGKQGWYVFRLSCGHLVARSRRADYAKCDVCFSQAGTDPGAG